MKNATTRRPVHGVLTWIASPVAGWVSATRVVRTVIGAMWGDSWEE